MLAVDLGGDVDLCNGIVGADNIADREMRVTVSIREKRVNNEECWRCLVRISVDVSDSRVPIQVVEEVNKMPKVFSLHVVHVFVIELVVQFVRKRDRSMIRPVKDRIVSLKPSR